MFCKNCGHKINKRSNYCKNCGLQTLNGDNAEILIWPVKLSSITLILTIFPLDYGFYYIGKTIIFFVALYYLIKLNKLEKEKKFFWFFLISAILYNPFLPVHLFYRFAWIIVDIVSIVINYKYLKNYNK